MNEESRCTFSDEVERIRGMDAVSIAKEVVALRKQLEAYKAAWSVNIMTKRIEELESKLEAVRGARIQVIGGEYVYLVSDIKAAIGEREE